MRRLCCSPLAAVSFSSSVTRFSRKTTWGHGRGKGQPSPRSPPHKATLAGARTWLSYLNGDGCHWKKPCLCSKHPFTLWFLSVSRVEVRGPTLHCFLSSQQDPECPEGKTQRELCSIAAELERSPEAGNNHPLLRKGQLSVNEATGKQHCLLEGGTDECFLPVPGTFQPYLCFHLLVVPKSHLHPHTESQTTKELGAGLTSTKSEL